MYELQTSVEINGASFGIRNKGDFRMVLDCFEALDDIELNQISRMYAALIIFYEDINSVEDIHKYSDYIQELERQMLIFFNCGDENLESNTGGKKLVDWQRDSNLIIPAINIIAHTEIRSLEYLHWWTFFGYYMSIGESLFSTVISIRSKQANNEKLEPCEKKFIQNNPEYFNIDYRSTEQKARDEYFRSLWSNSNG